MSIVCGIDVDGVVCDVNFLVIGIVDIGDVLNLCELIELCFVENDWWMVGYDKCLLCLMFVLWMVWFVLWFLKK